VDMLERLSDLIRPLVAWRPDPASASVPPKGATGDGGFKAIPEMMSILGCSAGELGEVLKALGFQVDRRVVQAAVDPSVPKETTEVPVAPPNGSETSTDVPAAPPDAMEMCAVPAEATPEAVDGGASADLATQPGAASVAADGPEAAPAVVWEEIWRPRRRTRVVEAMDTRPKPARRAEDEPRGGKARHLRRDGKGRPPRGIRHRDGPKPRREDHVRGQVQARPTQKSTFDPDSPFAALSSLRAALEKRTQD